MKRLPTDERCKATCHERWSAKAHQCPFAVKANGLCGTHLRSEQWKLGHKLDDRYRIRQLQAGYDELRTVCNRLKQALAEVERKLAASEADAARGHGLLRSVLYHVSDKTQWNAVKAYLADARGASAEEGK